MFSPARLIRMRERRKEAGKVSGDRYSDEMAWAIPYKLQTHLPLCWRSTDVGKCLCSDGLFMVPSSAPDLVVDSIRWGCTTPLQWLSCLKAS